MILTGRGPEQQSHGVDNALAYINLALALGQVGRAGGGYGCITGQGNGQGGREHGQKADQLPGYRRIDDPDARRHVAGVWGIPEEDLPGPGKSAFEMLSSMGTDGGVRALFVFGSNVAVSAPDARRIQDRLQALDFLVVSDFFLSETAALAHVVLPSAQWAEEDGTMTNLEGRVMLRSRALPAPGDVRTDLEAIVAIADALGRGALFPSSRARDVFDELRRATAGGPADYHGITYERIRKEDGMFWPCPDADASRHAAALRRAVSDAERPRALSRRRSPRTGRDSRRGLPADPHDRPRARALPVGNADTAHPGAAGARSRALRGNPPGDGRTARRARRRRHRPDDAAGLDAAAGAAQPGASVRTRCSCRFTGAASASINRLTNPALDPISRMPEFKVCAVKAQPALARSLHPRPALDASARVCDCNGMTRTRIVEAVLNGARSLQAVCDATKAGTGCGSCRPEVQAIIDATCRRLDMPATRPSGASGPGCRAGHGVPRRHGLCRRWPRTTAIARRCRQRHGRHRLRRADPEARAAVRHHDLRRRDPRQLQPHPAVVGARRREGLRRDHAQPARLVPAERHPAARRRADHRRRSRSTRPSPRRTAASRRTTCCCSPPAAPRGCRRSPGSISTASTPSARSTTRARCWRGPAAARRRS